MRELFNEAAQLSEDEQKNIVEIIRQAIAAEKHWYTLLRDPKSDYLLQDMVDKTLAEDAKGEAEEIKGDDFLS